MKLICSLCLFDPTPAADLDQGEREDRETLTVINGQMVCLQHHGFAQGNQHSHMISSLQAERG